MIEFFCNSDKVILDKPEITLLQFLHTKSVEENKPFAVAINNKVVPKKEWKSYKIQSNDKILIISPAQGG